MWWKTLWKKPTHMQGKLLSYLINCIPISSLYHINLRLSSAFVNTSAVCSRSWQFWILSILLVTRSQTWWWCKVMCFDHWWNYRLCVNTMEPSLSPLIIVGYFWGNLSSLYKFLSHVALHPASERATYSASVEESMIMVCFFDFHMITPPDLRKT